MFSKSDFTENLITNKNNIFYTNIDSIIYDRLSIESRYNDIDKLFYIVNIIKSRIIKKFTERFNLYDANLLKLSANIYMTSEITDIDVELELERYYYGGANIFSDIINELQKRRTYQYIIYFEWYSNGRKYCYNFTILDVLILNYKQVYKQCVKEETDKLMTYILQSL